MAIATKGWVIDLLKKFNKKKDVYSTDEQRIGTWIDGKPIYRKVIHTGELPTTTSEVNKTYDISSLNYKDIIKIDTYFNLKISATSSYWFNNQNGSGDWKLFPYINNNNLTLTIKGTGTAGYAESYVVIEYTKTTD